MNPYLPKRTRKQAKARPSGTPAFVLDFWRRPGALAGGTSVVAVQLHSLISHAGREGALDGLRKVWDIVDAPLSRQRFETALVADEFKLVVKMRGVEVITEQWADVARAVLLEAVDKLGFRLA